MYVILWEYVVRPGKATEFARAYGADGAWAELFRRADGFLETELLQEEDGTDRWLTIDRWRSQDDFEAFKTRFEADYHRLDDEFAALTLEEDRIGGFVAA